MIPSRRLSLLLQQSSSPSSSSFSSTLRRLQSTWLNKARADVDSSLSSSSSGVCLEKQFTDESVQKLLADLTGMDLKGKVFRSRRTAVQQRAHYALMTDERLEKTMERMKDEAKRFLQPVPFKEPRKDNFKMLDKDEGIAAFDQSRFVFTDITFDATDQDRAVVVREIDGTLRTANPEEHDRMNRVYYERPNRPVNAPSLFSDPWLQKALDRGEHEFVMDWACWFYEPDDPAFVKLSCTVFDRITDSCQFDFLYSTRHFATLAFYLALNGNIPPLLNWFGGRGRIAEAARLVQLQKTLHPNWRVAVSKEDSDRKIVEDFLRQNERMRMKMPDLVTFLKTGQKKEEGKESRVGEGVREDTKRKKLQTTMNAQTIGGSGGPLGSMANEYTVHVKKEESGQQKTTDQRGQRNNRRFEQRRAPAKKKPETDE